MHTVYRSKSSQNWVAVTKDKRTQTTQYLGTFKTKIGAIKLDSADRVLRNAGDLKLKYRVTPHGTVQVRTFNAEEGRRVYIGTFENMEVAKYHGQLYVSAQLLNRKPRDG